MKKIALTASTMFAAIALASAAQAADMPAPAAYDWTGFYLGANAGIAWNNSSVDNSFDLDGTAADRLRNKIDGDQTAFTAGGLLGYNYQIDQIVLGVEADFNYLGFSDDSKRSVDIIGSNEVDNITGKSSFEADWFGTIRGRLGYAIDNVLIYGTGGLAYGHMSADGKVTASLAGDTVETWKGSTDSTNWGWTVGGGMEYGIDNWSLGLEYLYVDLGSGEWNGNSDLFDNSNFKGDADYAFSTVRATVKYRFQ
jgi:outer membrane immunogenic protein